MDWKSHLDFTLNLRQSVIFCTRMIIIDFRVLKLFLAILDILHLKIVQPIKCQHTKHYTIKYSQTVHVDQLFRQVHCLLELIWSHRSSLHCHLVLRLRLVRVPFHLQAERKQDVWLSYRLTENNPKMLCYQPQVLQIQLGLF